jgi:hypothetical protein
MAKSRRGLALALIVVGTVVSFALGRVIWPDPPGSSLPDDLFPFFVLVSLVESIGFGLGLAFLVLGLSWVRRAGTGNPLAVVTYVSMVWMLVSWWPHDNLHRVLAHTDYRGLLRIEFGFHVTLIFAASVLALFVARVLATRGAEQPEPARVH